MGKNKGFFSGDFWNSVLASALGGVLSFVLISALVSGLMFTFFKGLGRELYTAARDFTEKVSEKGVK